MARVLLLGRDVLLLDEVTSAMDRQSAVKLERHLLSMPEVTLLYVTHKLHRETAELFDESIPLSQPEEE